MDQTRMATMKPWSRTHLHHFAPQQQPSRPAQLLLFFQQLLLLLCCSTLLQINQANLLGKHSAAKQQTVHNDVMFDSWAQARQLLMHTQRLPVPPALVTHVLLLNFAAHDKHVAGT